MTLEDLRAFAAAFEEESLSAAARRLGRSQPAIAQHVRRLERELGAELLARKRRGVAATPAGQLFYEAVRTALEQIERAREGLHRARDEQDATLSLAATAMAATGFLRTPILRLRKRRPQLRFHLEPTNTIQERLKAVRRRKADLALVPMVEEMPGFEVRPAFDTPLRLLVHRDDPLARRRRLRVRDLSSLRYLSVGVASATYRHVQRELAQRGLAFEPTAVADPNVAILMVELGGGQTFVPERQARSAERGGMAKALPIEGLPQLRMGWAARSFALIPKAGHEFLAIFENYVRRTRMGSRQHD